MPAWPQPGSPPQAKQPVSFRVSHSRIGLSLRAGQLKLGCEYLAQVIAGRIVEKCLRQGLLVLRNRRVGIRANDLAAAGRGQSINRHVVVLDEFEGGVMWDRRRPDR